MSEPSKPGNDVDPAYESYNSAIGQNKEEEQKENYNKLLRILEEEYGKEISCRQNQVEHIELQISKVRKLLHILRYVLVMSFYHKKELEVDGGDKATASTSADSGAPDAQSRIHPAVKKLLYNHHRNSLTPKVATKRKTFAATRRNVTVQEDVDDYLSEHEAKKMRPSADEDDRTIDDKASSCDISENATVQQSELVNLDCSRSRKKTKHRIVVGNISKWVPSTENDNLTHKWMLYVRGPKETPDLSHIVSKVVFYLHPSYKPHDVIEVKKYPFHLSRWGWGEFPVRVQIFFQVVSNKPIDIVHNIKLDDKHTGRQTLGNETLVDVFLYDTYLQQLVNKTESPIKEEIVDDEEATSLTANNINLDVTSTDLQLLKTDDTLESASTNNQPPAVDDDNHKRIFSDHCYSLPVSQIKPGTSIKVEPIRNVSSESLQNPNTSLIHGLGEFYLLSNIVQCNNEQFRAAIRSMQQKNSGGKNASIVSNYCGDGDSKPHNNSSHFVLDVPRDRFKNVGELLPYLFKRLPLCTHLANNEGYKRAYPFAVANSLTQLVEWNVGKKLSAEWSRAKFIKNLMIKENIYGSKNWNTKAILMYGRSHRYTPLCKFGLFGFNTPEKVVILNCFRSPKTKLPSNKKYDIYNEDIHVDVDSNADKIHNHINNNNKVKLDISDASLTQQCSYVRQTALDCGIVLKSEELEDGIVWNGSERMILEAVKSLADHLIRRAANYAVCTNKNGENIERIRKEHVETAINERTEMIALTQFKSRRRDIEFFT